MQRGRYRKRIAVHEGSKLSVISRVEYWKPRGINKRIRTRYNNYKYQ